MNNPNSKPIICGTDFSGPARAAADAAAALATRLDVPLLLVHASEIAGSPLTHEHLREEAQRLRDAGADLVAQVVEGVADEVLAQVAQQHQARLLV
ncbi:MAG: universal stress protein, partial [Terrimicrobiaceae bacterium]